MDLGATICTAKSPKCETCPIKDWCASYPCEGNDIVKKAQGKFKDSDRFYRGALVSFLRKHNVLRRKQVGEKLGLTDPRRCEKIIDSLIKDQFIIEGAGGKLSLRN